MIGYGAEIFNFGSGSGDIINNGDQLTGGSHSYTIIPPPFTPAEVDPQTGLAFLQKAARVTFRVTNGIDTKTKVVDIVQENPAILIENFHQRNIAGRSYQLTVKSNQQWTITSVIDNDGILTGTDLVNGKQGGLSVLTGNQLSYGISTNAGPARYADVVFSNNDNLFPDKTIPIYTADPKIANSFNIRPGEEVTIPLSKPYWVWGCEPLHTTLTGAPGAYLVWQDKPNLFGSITVENSQDPRDYRLRVTTNPGVEGNMLIGITIDGQTRWTYHIWVSNLIPEEETYNAQNFYPNIFQDVNLGAIRRDMVTTGNVRNTDYHEYGLMYQWGRPTPFAGIVATNTTASLHTLFNQNGETIDMQRVLTTADFNLPNALMNPTTFYLGEDLLGDWYTPTEQNLQNNDLWNDQFGEKTDFDPCPAGYRVPPMGLNNSVSPFSGFQTDPDNPEKNGKLGYMTDVGYCAPIEILYYTTGLPFYDPLITHGAMHIATPISSYSYMFYYTNVGIRDNDFFQRATGAGVRCVKDKQEY